MLLVSIAVSAPCPALEELVRALTDKGYRVPGAPRQLFNILGVEVPSEEEVLAILALVERIAAAHPGITFAPMAPRPLDSHEYSYAE